ncbi:MAG: methyltransferase domain-containing protein [Candidatus Binataceae bacterium]|nr:methyltransferase domain-containing protein [Candidatus Binataceae bacterium]
MTDWDPQLYHRFRRYRAEPFAAMLDRLKLQADERIIDLGCGTGENTIEIVRQTVHGTGLGIDSSPAMIDGAIKAMENLDPGIARRVRFVRQDFRDFRADREYTLVFSNAALQWVPDHRPVLAASYAALAPGGRLAFQIPSNETETAQQSMLVVAARDRWRERLADARLPGLYVRPLEEYRQMLTGIGFVNLDCYYRTFEHPMTGPAEVIEWSRATSMRPFLERLTPAERTQFEADLLLELEHGYATRGPLIFPFRRMFLWARRPLA